jgi:hypothetical protein
MLSDNTTVRIIVTFYPKLIRLGTISTFRFAHRKSLSMLKLGVPELYQT